MKIIIPRLSRIKTPKITQGEPTEITKLDGFAILNQKIIELLIEKIETKKGENYE